MVKTNLDRARISTDELAQCLHVLAAANHHQWTGWEGFIIPALENGGQARLTAIESGDLPSELRDLLGRDSKASIDVVSNVVQGFAYTPSDDALFERKLQQLNSWVAYARTKSLADYERWKLQCRTPFIDLSPDMQRSDYVEALLDLEVIASVSGLVLPDSIPDVDPLMGKQAARRLRRHRLGFHGQYETSLYGWSRTCLACNSTRGGFAY